MGIGHKIEEKFRTEDVKLNLDQTFDFSRLLIAPKVLEGLRKAGFVRPSPIQFEAIPLGRCGFDLVVQSKSGTGKTCVFAVIALESVNTKSDSTQVLTLAPTREIAVQISDVVSAIGCEIPKLKCHAFIGGLSVSEDKRKAKRCHVVIGTPGRIKQLIGEGVLNVHSVRLFVLDEADKLLDESFQRDINWIFNKLPMNKQILALSATYPEELATLLTKYMQSPTFIRLNTKNPALLGVKQFYHITRFHPLQAKNFDNKFPVTLNVLSSVPFGQCIIFSNYHMRAQSLCDKLNANGWPAAYICGQKTQTERLQAVEYMKMFKCRVLVSTDLLARGIDLENVNLVINIDVPQDIETYLHRIGRGGRFGSLAIAITIASEGEERNLLSKLMTEGKLRISPLPENLNSDIWNEKMPESTNLMDHNGEAVTQNFVSVENGQRLSKSSNDENIETDFRSNANVIETRKVGAFMIEDLKRENYIKLEEKGAISKRKAVLPKAMFHPAKTDAQHVMHCLSHEPTSNAKLFNALNALLQESTINDLHLDMSERHDSDDLVSFLTNCEVNGCVVCDDMKMACSVEAVKPDVENAHQNPLCALANDFLSLMHDKWIANLMQMNTDELPSDKFNSFLDICAAILPYQRLIPVESEDVGKPFNSDLAPPLESCDSSESLKDSISSPADNNEEIDSKVQVLTPSSEVEEVTLVMDGIDLTGKQTPTNFPRREDTHFTSQYCVLNSPSSVEPTFVVEPVWDVWTQWQRYLRGIKYQIWFSEYIKEMNSNSH